MQLSDAWGGWLGWVGLLVQFNFFSPVLVGLVGLVGLVHSISVFIRYLPRLSSSGYSFGAFFVITM